VGATCSNQTPPHHRQQREAARTSATDGIDNDDNNDDNNGVDNDDNNDDSTSNGGLCTHERLDLHARLLPALRASSLQLTKGPCTHQSTKLMDKQEANAITARAS
jgi:hypothetical protein